MNREEIEKEWQEKLREFIEYHSKKTEGMTEEEENEYIKENKVNEKLQQLQNDIRKKYNNTLKWVLLYFVKHSKS